MDLLADDLLDCIESIGVLGKALRHPLVFQVPLIFDRENFRQLNKMLEQKKERIGKAKKDKNWSLVIFLHERPFRISALFSLWAAELIPSRELGPFLEEVWVDSENLFQYPRKMILDMFEASGFIGEVRPEQNVSVYRGVSLKGKVKGFSWTEDLERAEWFARRFDSGKVYKALISPDGVLARFSSRGESEIVVNPSKLRNILVL